MINLDEREELIKLFDNYSSLLTSKQKQYFEAYYYDDLSLAEIAAEFDVSRNAVFDQIKKTISILKNYEENLHQLRNKELLEKAYESNSVDEIKQLIAKIIKE